jgi:addiction module HigA family antidote
MAGDRPGFRPVHPGVIIKRNIDALGVTIEAFADHIGTSRQNVHAIIRGSRAVTAEMAARLGRAFETSSRFWLNMQTNYDVWEPERVASILRIRPFKRGINKKSA